MNSLEPPETKIPNYIPAHMCYRNAAIFSGNLSHISRNVAEIKYQLTGEELLLLSLH